MKNLWVEKVSKGNVGPSSTDFVAIFEKKFGNIFFCVLYVFLKKTASQRKVDFWSKLDKFYQKR